MIAGLAGRTAQAVQRGRARARARLSRRAAVARRHEGRLRGRADRARAAVAREMPLVGFYLQPAVGGIVLPVSFWRRFAEIENVVAIKIAPFNRYRTLDVIRGVVEAGAEDRVTLYTGNDDHIVLDLLTPFTVPTRRRAGDRAHQGRPARALERVGQARRRTAGARACQPRRNRRVPHDLLALDSQITDCNAAIFDVRQRLSRRASPAATRSCGGRGCWRASGASIRTRPSAPARPRRSTASAPPIRISTTTTSCGRISSDGWRDGERLSEKLSAHALLPPPRSGGGCPSESEGG